MICRLYETPFFHTLDFHFVGAEMMIETRINVSLESMEPLLLTAHSLKCSPEKEFVIKNSDPLSEIAAV